MLEAIRSVENAVEGVAFGAMTIAPRCGGVLAVEIGVGVNVVLFAEPNDNSIADMRGDAAIVRVIRRADPGEGVVVGILVAILLFPTAVRIVRQRVGDILGRLRLEKAKWDELRGGDARTDKTAALEKRPAGKIVVHNRVGKFS